MTRVTASLLALSLLAAAHAGCPEPPLPRSCHLQQTQAQYRPAHPCKKTKIDLDLNIISYEGFCPEECVVVTACILWCDQVDAQQVEKHPPHPPVTQNLGSNSRRCNEHGQPEF